MTDHLEITASDYESEGSDYIRLKNSDRRSDSNRDRRLATSTTIGNWNDRMYNLNSGTTYQSANSQFYDSNIASAPNIKTSMAGSCPNVTSSVLKGTMFDEPKSSEILKDENGIPIASQYTVPVYEENQLYGENLLRYQQKLDQTAREINRLSYNLRYARQIPPQAEQENMPIYVNNSNLERLIPKFIGKEDPETFLEEYTLIANTSRWSDEERTARFRFSLRDEAYV